MNIEKLHQLYVKQNHSISTDTRKIKGGSIFFALKGANFNGNVFAQDAYDKGASYCVIDEEEYNTNDKFILVNDVLETLQKLATFHRRKINIPIIALTGSNGKTTTKELINVVLAKKFKTFATQGNLNNHIGVPLTLLSITNEVEIGIVEMGANHHKEIALLSSIAEPNYGYITNFGKAHLEGFGSVEGVIEAKTELYDYIISNDQTIFVNPNDAVQMSKTKTVKRHLLSNEVKFIKAEPFVTLDYRNVSVKSNLIGNYNYPNICCAITIGEYFGVAKDAIKDAIEEYTPTNNRSQIIKINSNEVILDAYNANPTSMEAAINNFNLLKSDKKILIVGDMFELGKNSEEEHQSIVNLIESKEFNDVILVGGNFFKTKGKQRRFEEFEELRAYLERTSILNTTLLIKGSRGMALERCLPLIS